MLLFDYSYHYLCTIRYLKYILMDIKHLVIEQPLVCLCCLQPAVAMVTVHEVSAADQRGRSVD